MCSADCFLAVLAVLFPPIAVWVKRGVCSADSIINVALLCLGYLPGLLHAWYIIAKYPDPYSYSYEPIEGGSGQRVYYYTATYPSVASHTQPSYAPQQQQGCHHNHQHGQDRPQSPRSHTRPQAYGTTAAPPSSSSPSQPVTETAVADAHKPTQQPQDNLPVANGMDHGEGSSAGPSQPPPSYSDVVKGDYKIQTA
ncbi:hypothetical protein TWF718_000906 [Orbilia javanica]|uniref:Stress response RCI peptide n=1 Tax=Orbilia javanica TaxID=47235 RepID=A0AAN8NGP7_9PEZI